MAVLDRIIIQNYRNIEYAELAFSHKFNCISGNNGEGKTNLIDAVHYLSMTRSAFSPSDKYNIRYGEEKASIFGHYLLPAGVYSDVSIKIEQGEKKIKVDEKNISKFSEHIGNFPIVIVSPADIATVSDSGEERRKFLNLVLSQINRDYLVKLQQYNKILAERNATLKQDAVDPFWMDVLNQKLSECASYLYEERKTFVKSLSENVETFYSELSSGKEKVSAEYVSDLDEKSLVSLLEQNMDKDKYLGYTSAGIHRDDIAFKMNGRMIKKCGSQGQQKSFVVSLKFAQYQIMKQQYSYSPILLLDDVFDKLDMNRVSNLLCMVSEEDFGQIFITDSNKIRMASIVDKLSDESAYFDCTSGIFTKAEL